MKTLLHRWEALALALALALAGTAEGVAQTLGAAAEGAVDSTLTVSLLTCSPGSAVYEVYGHTALRVHSEQEGLDVVYNYGAFDFNTPNFVGRFVLGECDYMLAAETYRHFLYQYYYRGSSVTEQVLNLTPTEAQALAQALYDESRPDSCVYRYNIFRNNCTTRARDVVEAHIRGKVIYPYRWQDNTFRTILHQYNHVTPWGEAGIDLLLGADLDTLVTERDEMFAPEYLMRYADGAIINNGRGTYRPLVRATNVLLPADAARAEAYAQAQTALPVSPALLLWALAALGVVVGAVEVWRRRVWWGIDVTLMTLQGLAGLFVCFISLFSLHPGVDSNWQVWLLNPLPLFFVVDVVRSDLHHRHSAYHSIAVVYITLFVLLSLVLHQDFSVVVLPLACLLLSRACVHLLLYRYGFEQS